MRWKMREARDDHLAKQVRVLYDAGVPTRIAAQRLRIGLDAARKTLRASYPDSTERDPMPVERRRGAAGDAARAAAG